METTQLVSCRSLKKLSLVDSRFPNEDLVMLLPVAVLVLCLPGSLSVSLSEM